MAHSRLPQADRTPQRIVASPRLALPNDESPFHDVGERGEAQHGPRAFGVRVGCVRLYNTSDGCCDARAFLPSASLLASRLHRSMFVLSFVD